MDYAIQEEQKGALSIDAEELPNGTLKIEVCCTSEKKKSVAARLSINT